MATLGNEKSYDRSAGIKTTEFCKGFQNYKKNEFLDFWISGFLYFFGFLAVSWERKELTDIRGYQNNRIFRALQISKQIEFLDFWISVFFWISGFLYFFYFWPYLGNEKSYWRSAGIKTTGFFKQSPPTRSQGLQGP